MTPVQTTSSLRALMTRRVGLARRVLLLSQDQALRQLLEANRCQVLVDPDDGDAVSRFDPHVVVAFDGLVRDDGAAAFRQLAEAAPEADLVFSCASSASAALLLRGLLGHTTLPAIAERDVLRWLRDAGYAVQSRDAVVEPGPPLPLAPSTEAALRQLLEQLNPDAVADRYVFTARRGVEVPSSDPTPRVLSVVVSSGDVPAALARTLASLKQQTFQPIEVVVIAPSTSTTSDGVKHVSCSSLDWATRTNAGIAAATGQYLATLEAGDTVAAGHFSALVQRLATGNSAWALAAAVEGLPAQFRLASWLRANAVHRQAVVIDRIRVGPMPLTFAETTPGSEAMRFARLAALFAPAWGAGTPSVQLAQPAAEELKSMLNALVDRPLRLLATLPELLVEETPSLRRVASTRAAEWLETLRRRGRDGRW